MQLQIYKPKNVSRACLVWPFSFIRLSSSKDFSSTDVQYSVLENVHVLLQINLSSIIFFVPYSKTAILRFWIYLLVLFSLLNSQI